MRKTFKLIAMALVTGAMLTACGKDKPAPEPVEPTHNYPEGVEVTNATKGEVKAGFADQIEITGSGFDPELDYVYIGYPENDETTYERVSTDVLTLRKGRVSFGAHIAADYLDKTIRVYLDRPGYDRMPLTENITFVMPDVSEGYIPDAGFRATLMSKHPQQGNPDIAVLFDSYGMLDVAAAATITKCGMEDYALNLYASDAKSLEGIELFTGIYGTVAGWQMTQIEEIDFSNWMNDQGIVLFFENNATLKKFVGAPYAYRIDLYKCDNLTYVDLGACKWCYNLQIWYDDSPTGYSYVTYLDMRRERVGNLCEGDPTGVYPSDPATDYSIFLDGAWMKVADNCHILVDYQFLLDKKQDAGGAGYATVYSAWQRGAAIDVYNSVKISEKIGTVPMYADNNDALTPTGANNWTPDGY